MKALFHVNARGLLLLCVLFLTPIVVLAKDFVIYDNVLEEKAAQKIEEMGAELFAKSGIKVILIAKQTGEKDILTFEKNFAKELTSPYVLLTLFSDEKKVDIYSSAGMEKEFDKEAILSPFPWRGTLIPLLTNQKKEASSSAALLNGYGDIVDQISEYRKIKLESSIGSSNKITIEIVKIAVYGFVAVLVLIMLFKRMKNRG
jgi:hypothetical protein